MDKDNTGATGARVDGPLAPFTAGIEELGAWSLGTEFVPRIAQWADTEREATAADTTIQLIAETGKPLNAIVEIGSPAGGEPLPVGGGRGALIRQRRQCLADLGQGNSGALRDFDDGDPAQHFTGIEALVAAIAPALDESLCLVEVQRGDGDAAALRDLADCELGRERIVILRFHATAS